MKIPQGVRRRKNCWGGWEYVLGVRNYKKKEFQYTSLFIDDFFHSDLNGWYIFKRENNCVKSKGSMKHEGPFDSLGDCYALFAKGEADIL